MAGSGPCSECGKITAFTCKCKECKNGLKENCKFFCSQECKMNHKRHPLAEKEQESDNNERIVLHSTLERRLSEALASGSEEGGESGESRSAETGTSKRKRSGAGEGNNERGRKSQKKKKPSDDVEILNQRKKGRQLTDKFKRVQEKIQKLERLTPTWDWIFEVDKNTYNARTSKHKYRSAVKASDLSKRNVTDRISRYFKECLNEVKQIEDIDSEYVVTIKAIKPEGESNRVKNIHEYVTADVNDSPAEDSQGSNLGNDSEDVLTSQEVDDEGFCASCRYCRDEIFLQDTTSYVACLKPAGKAHFAAHFACLGLYPTSKSERMEVRSIYMCPVHR